ncbi:hypothetical protein BH09BAC6_BH09BAC6_08620 [soil metagenome]
MIDFEIIHTGNRAIFWTDMESSRFLLKDEAVPGHSYQNDLNKYLAASRNVFKGSHRLHFPYTVKHGQDLKIIVFPGRPSWFAAKGDILLMMDMITLGATYTKLEQCALNRIQLDLLLTILHTKGLMRPPDQQPADRAPDQFFRCDDIMLLEATRRCNLTCKHCFNNSEFALPNENSLDELKNHIDYLISRKIGNNLVISGGEPLTRKDIFLLIAYAFEKGLSIELLTNGLIINEDILARLKYFNVKVRVSLDGFSAVTHEFLRGPGTFTKTVENIIRLVQSGITTGITTSFSAHNIHEVDLLENSIERTNVDFFQYIIMNQLGRAIPNNIVNSDDSLLFMKLHEILSRNSRVRYAMRNSTLANIIAGNHLGLYFNHCGVGLQTNFYVQSDGDIFPCRAMIQPEFKIGNLKNGNDLDEAKFAALRSLEVDSLNPICAACSFRYWCSGECRGENYLITGSLTSPTTYCDELIDGFTTCLFLTAKDPELYYGKSSSFLARAGRSDLITDYLTSVYAS